MKNRIIISVLGILCMIVWAIVLVNIFENIRTNDVKAQEPPLLIDDLEEENEQVQEEEQQLEEEKEGEQQTSTVDPMKTLRDRIKKWGIQKSDIAQIAPNGEISIDELITIVIN